MITVYLLKKSDFYPKIRLLNPTENSGNVFQLLEEISYSVVINGVQQIITIPLGFKSDGASLPGWTWSILKLYPLHPKIICAAILHDFIFRGNTNITFMQANKIFYKLCKCSEFDKKVMYTSLVLFGWKNYKKRNFK